MENGEGPADEPTVNTPIRSQDSSSYGTITEEVRPHTSVKCKWPVTVLFVSDSAENEVAYISHNQILKLKVSKQNLAVISTLWCHVVLKLQCDIEKLKHIPHPISFYYYNHVCSTHFSLGWRVFYFC